MQVCTIVARNYLAPARVLAKSLVASNPDARLAVVVIDAIDDKDDFAHEPFEFISPLDIGIEADEYLRMATMYEVMELATAIKPWILRTLLDRGAETATYLDPDIVVLGSLEEANCLAREHGIVLTPHITQPMPRDGLLPDEEIIMMSGTYNLGFVTVGKKAADFLDWWSEHLTRWAIVEPAAGLFTDQRWIDFVPSLFEHIVIRDPSYNVAYWNLYERPIGFDGNSFTARCPDSVLPLQRLRPRRAALALQASRAAAPRAAQRLKPASLASRQRPHKIDRGRPRTHLEGAVPPRHLRGRTRTEPSHPADVPGRGTRERKERTTAAGTCI